MAIVTSGTGKESTGGFAKVTGFLKVKDVIVNPNKEELVAYGVTWKEPNYEFEDSERGKASVIEFYFKVDESNFSESDNAPKDVILSTRVYLYPIVRKSQNENTQFINKFGNFVYASSVDSIPEWFDKSDVRPAYVGEEQLINFIKAWGDVRKGDACTLDTIENITKGNIAELKQLEKIWDTHKLKVIVGLEDTGDNKFQQVVYNKEYWRVFTNKLPVRGDDGKTQLVEYIGALPILLNEQYKDFPKADKLTFVPKVWTAGELKSVTPDSNKAPSSSSGGVSSAGLF